MHQCRLAPGNGLELLAYNASKLGVDIADLGS